MKTERTTIRRKAERARYDRQELYAILDEAIFCHVGVTIDGAPSVVPMLHARHGNVLYLHGSPANRTLRHLAAGEEACISATLLDGLVVTRAAFHLSANFRSAVIYGTARAVDDQAEKRVAMSAVVDAVVPGATADIRPPSARELRVTAILAVPLEEASVKVRSGGVAEDGPDLDLPNWAGVIPVRQAFGEPEPAADLRAGIRAPDYIRGYRRPVLPENDAAS